MNQKKLRRIAFLVAFCAAGVASVAIVASPVDARDDTQADPEITAKRIGLPPAGTTKRITVQIDPEEQRRRLAALAPWPKTPAPTGQASAGQASTGPGPAGPMPLDWYWNIVSPRLDERDGRFDLAVAALSQGPDGAAVTAPRMQHLQNIAAKHGAEILAATIGTDVSPALVLAVIGIESAGRIDAVSSAGAVGLMQLIPATATRFGVTDSSDPVQNIRGGVAYLNWLMNEFDNDALMVLAAYNSGENAVKKNGGVPPYAETRAYVPKVLAAWSVARGLCVTPPELVTDGCVFAVRG